MKSGGLLQVEINGTSGRPLHVVVQVGPRVVQIPFHAFDGMTGPVGPAEAVMLYALSLSGVKVSSRARACARCSFPRNHPVHESSFKRKFDAYVVAKRILKD